MSARPLLMIPGPVEYESEVLAALGRPTLSHTDPDFAREFGRAIVQMREVFGAPGGQPFIVAGSGTLAMELAAVNIIEAGDRVVVVNTGYFGDRMGAMLDRLGATVEHVRGPLGDVPDVQTIDRAI